MFSRKKQDFWCRSCVPWTRSSWPHSPRPPCCGRSSWSRPWGGPGPRPRRCRTRCTGGRCTRPRLKRMTCLISRFRDENKSVTTRSFRLLSEYINRAVRTLRLFRFQKSKKRMKVQLESHAWMPQPRFYPEYYTSSSLNRTQTSFPTQDQGPMLLSQGRKRKACHAHCGDILGGLSFPGSCLCLRRWVANFRANKTRDFPSGCVVNFWV